MILEGLTSVQKVNENRVFTLCKERFIVILMVRRRGGGKGRSRSINENITNLSTMSRYLLELQARFEIHAKKVAFRPFGAVNRSGNAP